jgi:hypothetical protein
MNALHSKRTLTDSLMDMLPAATIISATHTEWHSATYSGLRSLFEIILPGKNATEQAELFRACLPDHQFNLRRYMVADIAVTQALQHQDGVRLTIEALLLDE